MTDPVSEMARFERLAEAAYEAMYDARPPMAKGHYEDAMLFLGRALAEAERMGDIAAVAKLTLRREHIRNVYDHQIRGVG